MPSKSTWPIRVGGEYLRQAIPNGFTFMRVLAFNGEEVVYQHVWREDGDVLSVHTADPETFRRLYCPEDQSPIPALVAALEKALEAHGFNDPCQDENLPQWVVEARSALEKARPKE